MDMTMTFLAIVWYMRFAWQVIKTILTHDLSFFLIIYHQNVFTKAFSVSELYPTDCENSEIQLVYVNHCGGQKARQHTTETWDRLLMWAVALQWWQKLFNSVSKSEVLVALRWSRWCLYDSIRWSTSPLNLAV